MKHPFPSASPNRNLHLKPLGTVAIVSLISGRKSRGREKSFENHISVLCLIYGRPIDMLLCVFGRTLPSLRSISVSPTLHQSLVYRVEYWCSSAYCCRQVCALFWAGWRAYQFCCSQLIGDLERLAPGETYDHEQTSVLRVHCAHAAPMHAHQSATWSWLQFAGVDVNDQRCRCQRSQICSCQRSEMLNQMSTIRYADLNDQFCLSFSMISDADFNDQRLFAHINDQIADFNDEWCWTQCFLVKKGE